MKNLLILLSMFFIVPSLFSQNIAINNSNDDPHASAMLDVSSTTKGVLIPRMTKSQRDAISTLTDATGLLIYQTDQSPGFYFYNGSSWEPVGANILAINDLTDAISDGSSVFLGEDSGINDDGNNTNVGVGIESLKSNTTGSYNSAVGFRSLMNNTIGWRNTALGRESLVSNTSGNDNIAIGKDALRVSNGNRNIAAGTQAFNFTQTGNDNVGIGHYAMRSRAGNDGNFSNNTGIGSYVMESIRTENTGAGENTAVGSNAMRSSTSAKENVAIGFEANKYNLTGDYNTVVGYQAGRGPTATYSASGNVFLGYKAGFNESGSNKLYIENSNSSSPLIGGDFDIDELYLNSKVGVNTTSPLTQLQVDGNITFAPAGLTTDESRFIGQSIASQSSFDASNGFGGMEVENIDRPTFDDSAQQLHFWTHHQGYESVRRMTIDTVGFVGIGTERPDNILEVARNGAVSSIISTTYRPSSFGAGSFIGRAARGTKDAPLAVQAGDYLASFNARGYGSTGFSSLPRGRLAFTAAQNWTDTEQGSHLILETVPLNKTSDQERLKISSQGNVGIGTVGLPDPQHKLHIVQDSAVGNALRVVQNASENAVTFEIPNNSSTGHTLNVYNEGSGYGLDLVIKETGTGPGGRFTIDNTTNDKPAIYGEHNGLGNVAEIKALNGANANSALNVFTKGSGPAGEFSSIGTGSAGVFTINNDDNEFSSIFATTSGKGHAGRFQINNSESNAVTLFAKTNGSGPALGGNNEGSGVGGFFNILDNSNTSNALEVKTEGLGSAAYFQIDNTGSTDTVVVIEGNGSGPSIVTDGTIDMAGFKMPTSPTSGHVLTSDGSGVGSWQAPSFDFSDGGEAAGSNRTLGNINGYSLGLMTNNIPRIHISSDGMVGIGTTSPGSPLEVIGDSRIEGDLSVGHTGVDKQIFFNGTVGDAVLKMYSSGDFGIGTDDGVDMHLAVGNDFKIQTLSGSFQDRLYISNEGKVGIGTITPTHLLQLESNTDAHFTLKNNGDNESSIHFDADRLASDNHLGQIVGKWSGNTVSRIEFISGDDNTDKDDGYITFSTSTGMLNERVRISQDGKVGIGTTSPQSALQVNGGVQISNDSGTATAAKVGTLRYWSDSNNSYVEMCMQTGTSTYAWVIIKQNTW